MDWLHALRLAQALSILALCAVSLTPRAALSQRVRVPVALLAFALSAATLTIDLA